MEGKIMTDMNKINDEALENVTGGARRKVSNDSCGYAFVRSGPGKQFDVEYKVYNGETVYTTGYHKYSGGYDWYELDDGNFIAGSLIGY
jgi:uncharacterized protein YgiM (DUF1202 family)